MFSILNYLNFYTEPINSFLILVKESGLILLQTIPDDINIDSLRVQLLQAFPDIINVHDLHVWQFTADKIFSTAHIIFLNPRVSEQNRIIPHENDRNLSMKKL